MLLVLASVTAFAPRAELGAAGLRSAHVRPARSSPLRATATETAPSLKCKPYDPSADWSPKGIVDEVALLEKNWESFPIKPEDAVNRAKWVIAEPRFGTVDDSCLAPDFEFCAPFIGPLGKADFLEALGSFKLEDALDITDNFHAFRADPFQPGRIWYNTRSTAIHSGKETPMLGKPTGKSLELPPQSFSIIFNEEGLVREFTVGYVMDRRIGNTGGLGGAFAFFYGVGKPLPIPECHPYKPSRRLRFFQTVSRTSTAVKKLLGRDS